MSPDERIAQIDERIKAIPGEMILADSKLGEAIKNLKSIDGRIVGLRDQRKGQLAADQKADVITREIRSLREEKEPLEDLIAGLKERIELLQREFVELPRERAGRCLDAAREAAIPLIRVYNEQASKLAEITKEIHLMMRKYNVPLSRYEANVIRPSSWESFEHVCSLVPWGEEPRPFFNARTFSPESSGEGTESTLKPAEPKISLPSFESEM
jgi:chromosome segregation ATPase